MANWKKVVVSGSAAELDSLRIANNGLVVTGSVKAGLSNSNQANKEPVHLLQLLLLIS